MSFLLSKHHFGFVFLLLLLFAASGLEGQKKSPNIVLIMADDLGYECIRSNGGTSYQTPNIDRLAETGMHFSSCHSQPLCTPSRVQIMTGIYNVRNYTAFGTLERGQVTFAQLFKKAGYQTVIAGKWQLGSEEDSPGHFGFDEYCLWQHKYGRTDEQYRDTRFSNPRLEINGQMVRYTGGEYGPELVSDYICNFMERNQDKPFLAYYPMILTHCPFTPTPDSRDWIPDDMGSLSYKGDTAYFDDMVIYMDKMVGKIVSKLEELGLRENTLILFTGDNGTDLPVVSQFHGHDYPGGKGSTADNGTHVPLVASWPLTIVEGSECDEMVDFSDFLPTICQAAGIDIPDKLHLDGRSFFPQLIGEPGNPRDWIYGWYARDGKSNAREWVRNHNYKLYRSGDLFNVKDDLFEEHPIDSTRLSSQEQEIHKEFMQTLDYFNDKRFSGIPEPITP